MVLSNLLAFGGGNRSAIMTFQLVRACISLSCKRRVSILAASLSLKSESNGWHEWYKSNFGHAVEVVVEYGVLYIRNYVYPNLNFNCGLGIA